MIPSHLEDAFLSKYEKEKEALGVLFPIAKELAERIKLITTLTGRAPNLNQMYLAHCEWEFWDAMEQDREVDWDKLDPVKFLSEYAPSLKGRHADRAVEIARASPVTSEKTILDRFFGRE